MYDQKGSFQIFFFKFHPHSTLYRHPLKFAAKIEKIPTIIHAADANTLFFLISNIMTFIMRWF